MKRFVLAAGLMAALASPALAVVGAPPVRDPDGVRRHTVALLLQRGLCTGVLIQRDLILTAAHCLANNRIRSIVTLDPALKPRFLAAAAVTTHPSFRYAARPVDAEGADIALVRLAEPAPGDMAPVRISRFGETGDLTLAGFGVNGERNGKAGTLREAPMRARAINWRDTRMIAAIGGSQNETRLGSGGCRGDSGGPLYAAGASSVVGIVSWSSGAPGAKGSCGGLTMATEIGDHTAWISAAGEALRFSQDGGAQPPRAAAPRLFRAPSVGTAFPDLARDSMR